MNSSSSSWKVPSLVSIGAILPLYLFLLIIFHTNIQQVNGEMTTIQLPIPGRHQWPDRDGYCGSNSIQMNMLYHGAWISQKIVRLAVDLGNCTAGGVGDEILHNNIECALTQLKVRYDSWKYKTEPRPQYKNYLIWVKQHLAQYHPVVMFIFCKGDSHGSHGGEKGYGYYDHIEPIIGITSNHSLEVGSSDLSIYYPDDQLIHHSDWDQKYYIRPFATMYDTPPLDGNCAHVMPIGGGPNEAYPCIPEQVDYGYALLGRIDPLQVLLPVHVQVNTWKEPDIDEGEKPILIYATITMELLVKNKKYLLLRYDDIQNIPTDSSFSTDDKYDFKHEFVYDDDGNDDGTKIWKDPNGIQSDTSANYFCVEL